MLFEIKDGKLNIVNSSWKSFELELENMLIKSTDENAKVFEATIFGEPLLLIRNQVRTRQKKRADILALDRFGNGVIVELKKDIGMLGVETQALQYLADFSNFKGQNFINKFGNKNANTNENILSFLGANARIEDINKKSRIILVASSFDPTIYSMGEWLSDMGVPFRCIEYNPIEVEGRCFLSFSIAFDRSYESIFPISFSQIAREPGIFWHNISSPTDEWWKFLVEKKQIPACFEDKPGDQGEKLLTSYINGDRIVAYAKGYGAVGWGIIEDTNSYKLLNEGHEEDRLNGSCLHRLGVSWQATAKELSKAIENTIFRDEFGIYWPLSTSVTIDKVKGEKFIKFLSDSFNK